MTGRRLPMRAAPLLAAALLASACVDIDIQRVAPARPARPPFCDVQFFPGGRPGFDVVDLATANLSCAKGRDSCLDELRKAACVVGADTVYGLAERKESMYVHFNARLAARKENGKE